MENLINISISLGDIIQITYNDNNELYYVDYCDENMVLIKNQNESKELLLENGFVKDDNIKNIQIIKKELNKGFAKINNLDINTYIKIIFVNDESVTGIISTIVEDMIEVSIFPNNETIYIDFEYKGLPKHLNIKNIEIIDRTEIEDIIEDRELEEGEIDESKEQSLEEEKQDEQTEIKEEEKLEVDETDEQIEEKEEELEEPPKKDETQEEPIEEERKEETKVIRAKRVKKFKQEEEIDLDAIEVPEDLHNKIINKLPKHKLQPSIPNKSHFMNNRENFSKYIVSLWKNKKFYNAKSIPSKKKKDFEPFLHQKIILEYLNVYSPYRGLLIYHGLGSGKTCTSISIAESFNSSPLFVALAEGLIHPKKIIVMTPGSLKMNYQEQLRDCGNQMYKTNQYWQFIKTDDTYTPEILAKYLQLPVEYIKNKKNPNPQQRGKGGAWMVDKSKSPNYTTLNVNQKISLDEQISQMIENKYNFITYNGDLTRQQYFKDFAYKVIDGVLQKINPFDNTVVIIDEIHNLISRIVNQIKKKKDDDDTTSKKYELKDEEIIDSDKLKEKKINIALEVYHLLMSAKNCRIVLLSGTPVVNYPNEIGILFNILRGYIKTYKIKIKNIRRDTFLKDLFEKDELCDYVEFKNNELVLTQNPLGYISTFDKKNYSGVYISNEENNSDNFRNKIISILRNNKIEHGPIIEEKFTALPDKLETFIEMFFDENKQMKNETLFKRRIIGLTSYFKSPDESLMPKFEETEEFEKHSEIPMSLYQFEAYKNIRVNEIETEEGIRKSKRRKGKKSTTEELYNNDSTSTYRIFSRQYCNFVFPINIKRPLPRDGIESTILNQLEQNENDQTNLNDEEYEEDPEYLLNKSDKLSYMDKKYKALKLLKESDQKYLSRDNLSTYSPKFLKILDNLDDVNNKGCHLVYSQFKHLEGLGIFSLVLEENGYYPFLLKTVNKELVLDIPSNIKNLKDLKGKFYTIYSGNDKETIRNIYNSNWDTLNETLKSQLKQIHNNNYYGEIIKIFMITQRGAEGINLKNTKFVHIMEPYWHPVRTDQVLGRARRIGSHLELPKEDQTVTKFTYVMKLPTNINMKEISTKLFTNDMSQFTESDIPFTSDQTLFETSNNKKKIMNQLLENVKQSAIDCTIHSEEKGKCFILDDSSTYTYNPNIKDDKEDKDRLTNVNTKKIKGKKLVDKENNITYIVDNNNIVYDFITKEKIGNYVNNKIEFLI